MGDELIAAARMKLKNQATTMRQHAAARTGTTAAAATWNRTKIKTPYVNRDTAVKIAMKVRDVDATARRMALASATATAPLSSRGSSNLGRQSAASRVRATDAAGTTSSGGTSSGASVAETAAVLVAAAISDAAVAAAAAAGAGAGVGGVGYAVFDDDRIPAAQTIADRDIDGSYFRAHGSGTAAVPGSKARVTAAAAADNTDADNNAAPEPEYLDLEGARILELMWTTQRDSLSEIPFTIGNLQVRARAGLIPSRTLYLKL